MDKGWTTDKKVIDKCGVCDDIEPIVSVDCEVWEKIKAMSAEMKNKEWLGYLIGTIDRDDDYYKVTDIYVPEQEVSYSTVNVIEDTMLEGIIGTVHSHHSMGAFHSKTDEDFVGSNHDICIVYSNKGAATKIRQHLPCGHCALVDADLMISYPTTGDIPAFIEASKTKIKEKTYTRTYQPPQISLLQQGYLPTQSRANIAQGDFCEMCMQPTDTKQLKMLEELWLCPECLDYVKHWGVYGY